jgi:5-oxoprolinase (ATP-hydrolysing)
MVLFSQETFRLLTPGGGGFGLATGTSQSESEKPSSEAKTFVERGSVFEYRQAQESA